MSRTKLKKHKKLSKMERVFQPTREELLHNKFSMKGAWKNKFNNNNPIVVELGCGKGEYSVALGKMNTEVNYIGIDIKGARIYSGAEIVEKENLTNVYFLRIEIEYLDYVFEENEIDEIWLTFPDPQIKFSRRKKRLISPHMLKKYKMILKNTGVVNLKTDSLFLHGYTLGLLENGPYKIIRSMYDIHNNFNNDSRLEIKTYYEKMFLDKNQPITYLSFSFL